MSFPESVFLATAPSNKVSSRELASMGQEPWRVSSTESVFLGVAPSSKVSSRGLASMGQEPRRVSSTEFVFLAIVPSSRVRYKEVGSKGPRTFEGALGENNVLAERSKRQNRILPERPIAMEKAFTGLTAKNMEGYPRASGTRTHKRCEEHKRTLTNRRLFLTHGPTVTN